MVGTVVDSLAPSVFESTVGAARAAAYGRLHVALDDLDGLAMDPCSDEEVLADWRERERLRRRLASGEHAIITQVETRSLPYRHGARSAAVFASQLLRISPGEAHVRVRAAGALGPRRTVTGLAVAPLFAAVAAAQAHGTISEQHAQVIVSAVQKLPATIRHDLHATMEQILLDVAREQHPRFLEQHATELGAYLDPDTPGREHAYRDKHRDLRLTRRPDGSAHLSGDLTPECAEHLHTHLDAPWISSMVTMNSCRALSAAATTAAAGRCLPRSTMVRATDVTRTPSMVAMSRGGRVARCNAAPATSPVPFGATVISGRTGSGPTTGSPQNRAADR